MSVAERLAIARKALGLTQAQVAERMHITPQAVGHHETGRSQPSNEHLVSYARIYRVPVEWILTGKGDTPNAQSAEVVEIFERIDSRERERALRILRSFLDDNKNGK